MYEHHSQRLLSQREFLARWARHVGVVAVLVLVSLAAGMAGYMGFEHLGWSDAFLNAAMLLGGMGPVNAPVSVGGKLFAGVYALYAGLFFIVAAGVILAPVLHRMIHRFHLEQGGRR
jgi:hypothetical protein